jgi:hypothetical protein
LARDIDEIRTRDDIRRVMIDVLRELGLLPEAPKSAKPQLSLVESTDEPKE